MATSSYSSSSSESRESEASVSPVQLPPTPPPTSIAIFKSPRESKSSSSKTSHWSSSEESLPAAAFYGPLDAKNPLLVSCDKEIRELLGFIKKKKALATSEEQKHEFHRRCATTLFNIWTKYAPRLPPDYYNEKLLKVGDSLCQIKEYKLALLQCYRRYLQQFGDFDEHKEDVNQFKTVFFPKGFGDETAELTFHVLSSKNICSYKLVCDNDANLQNKESVSQCLHILSSLRLIMQVALPQEHLCWIIFNGTIYIYTICRKLMLIGLSAKALEYLLWASMCMESSAPLLSLRYLTWRATLYTAVCQCHYDCQTSIHGEMVWPRTVTERLLDELFDCTASRFLAVLEALSDSSRRILQTGPLVTDEVELRDVVSELFMAGKELLILSNVGTNGKLDFPKTFFLEHMIERKNIISVCAAVKFTKLAFTYEEWGLFESLAGQLIQFLQKQDIPHLKRAEKDLILLLAVEPLINIKKNKGLIFPLDSDKEGQSVQVYLKHIARHESCVRSCGYSEDIFNLAAILHFCVCVPNKRAPVEQLFYAYELLDKAIAGMNWNFMLTTLSDGSSTIDHCYAKVLAYRGGYWTLLQNCCRAFWNFAQELQILLKQAVDTYKAFPINQDSFLCACVLPFSLGTELLIDMLIKLQSTNSVKPVEDKGDFSVPSCYGNIKSDNGGSSLIFEHPLDDINVVDLKWIHDYVLKSLEILYQVEKWETLVSLAIQFNTISHERYTEQVTPLLVYAQRQLLTRIQKFNGPDIAQQACARYEADNGQKITCRNFIGKQLMIDPSSPRTLPDAEGCSDLLKMLILSEHQRAKQLVCVPVDVEDTLRCFRETLEKSKYHNRSVRHTKKLLLLFLAQTQGEKGGISNMQFSSGKVEFCLGTEEMHMSTPPDLSQENFRVFSSVEKSKLPYSQLGLVISSFYQTIDVLQDSNQRSLKVQLLHSLGSLFVFAEKKRAAFKCWCQALDDIFRKPDALHTWKEFGTSIPSATNNSSPPVFKDYSEEFLSKLGIWGCLQGAVIAAKIAQFIKTANVKQRTNCCILSALLFQSLLRTTLLHPKAEHSYAQYEITQLLPGIELFTDQFRADICSVIASLYYVIRELHYAKYNLIAEILIDLGFFSEASYEIFQIFHGKNLPSTIPAGYKTIAKVKVLEDLVNKGLPLILVTLGHQHLLNKYNFVKAHFFISLAATINCIPDSSSKTLFYTVAVDKNKPNTPNFKDLYPKDNENVHAQSLRLRDESTLCMMKSLLLTEAEEKINSLLSDMDLQCHKPLCQCSAQELEILVEARLQLAAIALQRQRAPYGAAIVYSTLKLLQDSKIFKKRMPEDLDSPTSPVNSTTENKDDSEFLDPISLNAREYFNIHLWLKCRLMLVTAFIAQIRGIGIMKENDMTDCLSLINEVCMEAKSADDMEILAELLMQAVILGLQEKHLKADIIGNLQLNNELENTVIFSQQEIINLLDGNEFLSPPSWLTLVRSLLLMDDLTKAEKFKDASSKDDKLIFLNQAHSILIAQMLTFGETIKFPLSDADFANPQQPLKNIYLPHVILLAKVKLRIGHTLSKQVYSQNKKKDITKWLPSLHIFEMALKLCKVAALEECEVEAEILFQKGRIERQMLKEDKCPISQPLGKRQSSIKEHAATRFEKFSLLAWIAIRAAAQVLLLYAYNLKPLKISDIKVPTANNLYVGTSWIPLNRQVDAILRKPDGDDNG
ncbi:Putative uncharacterized protein C12orf63 [Cricetulus griseus]|uniref:Cilia- and flagella-associated protein 54 n=1 Tax=Cricetulus griseus TaxID=10029 RepID=G3HBI6_CRIGR|nr:Putative uncharacterized protein C12orf63 [Cricetulus griseus]